MSQLLFKLRDYQETAIGSVLGKSFSLIVLPCGSGKSVIMSEITRRHKCKTLILVNKNILVENTARYIESKIYHASSNRKEFGEVTIACYQSLIKAKKVPEFDLLIIDEIHEFNLDKLKFIQRKKTIGFTATPIGFDRADYFKSSSEMTPEYLVPVIYKGSDLVDLNKIKTKKGEYVISDMENEYENKNQIIAEKIKLIKRNYIVVICISIDHCDLMAALLGAYVCHSRRNERELFERNGGIICVVMMVNTGYDFPPIDCIVFARATRSHVLYAQVTGRGMRKAEGKKDLLLVDFGRVIESLGSIYDLDFFNLEKKLPKMRLCPACEELTSKPICNCGFVFLINKTAERKNTFKLDTEVYEGATKISQVRASKHLSAAGNECIKIDYMKDLFTRPITEYIPPYKKAKFFREVGAIDELDFFTNKHYLKIKAVSTYLSGKYLSVKERFYD